MSVPGAEPIPATPAPVAEPVAAPVAAQPVVATPSPEPGAPQPTAGVSSAVTAPAATTVPETPAAPPAEALKAVEPAPSLLAPDPAKPAEPVAAEPVAEPAPVAEPQPLPAYEAYTLPEGVKLDPDELKAFNTALGEFERDGKVDHAAAQAFGQKMVGFYVDQVNKAVTSHDEAGSQAWTQMRDGWRQDFRKDKDLGGNREQTTLAQAKAMVQRFGGTQAQQAELQRVLSVTGAGDNIHVIRVFANIAKVLGEGRPVPATVPKSPELASKKSRRYGAPNGANGAI